MDGSFIELLRLGTGFFKIRSGSWFWTMGFGNPFGEDVELGNSSLLDSLVDETSNLDSTKELLDSD